MDGSAKSQKRKKIPKTYSSKNSNPKNKVSDIAVMGILSAEFSLNTHSDVWVALTFSEQKQGLWINYLNCVTFVNWNKLGKISLQLWIL